MNKIAHHVTVGAYKLLNCDMWRAKTKKAKLFISTFLYDMLTESQIHNAITVFWEFSIRIKSPCCVFLNLCKIDSDRILV